MAIQIWVFGWHFLENGQSETVASGNQLTVSGTNHKI